MEEDIMYERERVCVGGEWKGKRRKRWREKARKK
jgi:hypothetical protein|tara:strand:+ start:359 stop:460 length:102 start_codon:yes stop_codon:yes gene_type:complete